MKVADLKAKNEKLTEAVEWAANNARLLRQLSANLQGDDGTLRALRDVLEGIEQKSREALSA